MARHQTRFQLQLCVRCVAYNSLEWFVCDEHNSEKGQTDEGVCDIQHIVHSDKLFVIRKHNRNGDPDQSVCDIRHTVYSDEFFSIRQHNRNYQPDQGVCDGRHTLHTDELFASSHNKWKQSDRSRCVQYTAYSSLWWTVCDDWGEHNGFDIIRCVWYWANRSVISTSWACIGFPLKRKGWCNKVAYVFPSFFENQGINPVGDNTQVT